MKSKTVMKGALCVSFVVLLRNQFLSSPSKTTEHAVSLSSVSDNNAASGKDIVCNIDSDKRGFLRKELSTPCLKQGYSQGNQDCQLDKIFEHIGTMNKYYVEYGFNTKVQCGG